MNTRVVTAAEFKAKCLSLIDEVSAKGGSITVTKRGRPMATLGPVHKVRRPSLEGILKGKVHIPDEILMADKADAWEAIRDTK